MFPWWRRDGKGLVYLSVKTGKWQVFGFDLLTKRERVIARGDGRGQWSPDGQHLATPLERQGNHDIYRLNRSGHIVERLTHHPGIDTSPTWSPEGDRIAFSSDRHGSLQIYVLEVATGAIRRLTFQGSYNTSPDWSPTGELIAFTGRSQRRDEHLHHTAGRQRPADAHGQPLQRRGSVLGSGRTLSGVHLRPVRFAPHLHHAPGR